MKHISLILQECELLKADHEPDGWPAIQMQDVTALCRAVKEAVPSLDRLQDRLEQGAFIDKADEDCWGIFDKDGECLCWGKTIREMMVNLIWLDC